VPEFKVLAATVLNLRVDVSKHNLDLDWDGHRLPALNRAGRKVSSIVKIEFFDWRELGYPIRPEHQVQGFAYRALAYVVRSDDQAVPVEVQLGALDATKIRDLQSYDFHLLACLSIWETPIYSTILTTMKMVQIGHAMHLDRRRLECLKPFFGATYGDFLL
jgi:hypothetical protein